MVLNSIEDRQRAETEKGCAEDRDQPVDAIQASQNTEMGIKTDPMFARGRRNSGFGSTWFEI